MQTRLKPLCECCSSQCGATPGSRSSTAPRARGSFGLSAPGLWLSSAGSLSPQSWDRWECRPSFPGCSLLSGWYCTHAFLEMSYNPTLNKNSQPRKIQNDNDIVIQIIVSFSHSELLIAEYLGTMMS